MIEFMIFLFCVYLLSVVICLMKLYERLKLGMKIKEVFGFLIVSIFPLMNTGFVLSVLSEYISDESPDKWINYETKGNKNNEKSCSL